MQWGRPQLQSSSLVLQDQLVVASRHLQWPYERNGFKHIVLSDVIRAERDRELEQSKQGDGSLPFPGFDERKSLQDFGNEKRKVDGAYWIKAALKDENLTSDDRLVIESIRNPAEAEELRIRFSPQFFLVAIHASTETRWDRVRKKYGGEQFRFARDDERDADEDVAWGQQVTKCVQFADYTFVNEKPAGAQEARLKKIYSDLESDLKLMEEANSTDRPQVRAATSKEAHMATAYSQSHRSFCIKRHVGAVIAGPDGLPRSLGYNENPVPMKPCIHEFSHCFKDQDMLTKLESMDVIYCPSCGYENRGLNDPWQCHECSENLKLRLFPSRNMELCTAIHAEERAIRSLRDRDAAKGGTLYTTTFPCFQCSRYIVDAGIAKVVYVEAYPVKEAVEFLMMNNVVMEPFNGFRAVAFNQIFRHVQ